MSFLSNLFSGGLPSLPGMPSLGGGGLQGGGGAQPQFQPQQPYPTDQGPSQDNSSLFNLFRMMQNQPNQGPSNFGGGGGLI